MFPMPGRSVGSAGSAGLLFQGHVGPLALDPPSYPEDQAEKLAMLISQRNAMTRARIVGQDGSGVGHTQVPKLTR